MYKTKSELYEVVKDIMTLEEFESEIKKRVHECEDLLTDEAIAYLIVDELGKKVVRGTTISELKNGDNVSLTVVVEELGKIREFNKKDGTKGTVANITVSDETGTCRFTLWNKDVEALTSNKITVGSKIKIINGYVKTSNFGTEISTGRWGMFSVEK
jgi:replication factor A1